MTHRLAPGAVNHRPYPSIALIIDAYAQRQRDGHRRTRRLTKSRTNTRTKRRTQAHTEADKGKGKWTRAQNTILTETYHWCCQSLWPFGKELRPTLKRYLKSV